MANREGSAGPLDRIGRELERERHERALRDAERSALATLGEELRSKDARERADSSNLKRHPGR